MDHTGYLIRHEALLRLSAANVNQMRRSVLEAKELVAVSKRVTQACRDNLRALRDHRRGSETDPIARDAAMSFSRVTPLAHAGEPCESMARTTLIRNSMGLMKEMLDMLREIIAASDKETFFELQKKIRTCARTICRPSSTIH
jgi:hypothetical protein